MSDSSKSNEDDFKSGRKDVVDKDPVVNDDDQREQDVQQDQSSEQATRPDQDLEAGKEEPEEAKDPNLVTWNGPNDPANPKTWSFGRKWAATGLVSLFTFMTPIASSMIAPAQPYINADLNVTSTIEAELMFSIFLLAFVIGPHTQFETPDRTHKAVFQRAFVRVFVFLGTQPIVQFLALYMALVYGIIYLMLSTFPRVWTNIYHESTGIGGLNYISLMIGLTIGAQTAGRLIDIIYRRLKAQSANKEGRPEFRIPLLFVSTALIAGGRHKRIPIGSCRISVLLSSPVELV